MKRKAGLFAAAAVVLSGTAFVGAQGYVSPDEPPLDPATEERGRQLNAMMMNRNRAKLLALRGAVRGGKPFDDELVDILTDLDIGSMLVAKSAVQETQLATQASVRLAAVQAVQNQRIIALLEEIAKKKK